MAKSDDTNRKSPQEVEIDHLLAEEFSCDPEFSARFAEVCKLTFQEFRVQKAVPEPQLSAESGYGDLLVEAEMDGCRVALLIEDKIDANAAPRQAARYAAEAQRLLLDGWDRVVTVLVAPASYKGERESYDVAVNLEKVREMLDSPDPVRREYRRKIIERALEKKANKGVKNPDIALHRLHSDYRKWMEKRCRDEGLGYQFPPLREEYSRGSSWIGGHGKDKISVEGFPDIFLRHRLWTDSKARTGSVDLIIASDLASDEQERLEAKRPARAEISSYGEMRNRYQVSLRVPEMKQSSGFNEAVAENALEAMKRLVACYREWSKP
ncbi:MAG: hypothetical protein OXC93_04645 [Rhodospirillaceae bacterium]|nr:hypothetical protein [Rhodospirillaceae bacterium]